MKTLEQLVRPNIGKLTPYSCARDEYKGEKAKAFLDANENPYNTPWNRYPDPLQHKLKEKVARIKGVRPENIFLGNGSDEAIDLAYRIFCRPQIDNVVAIEPTYGMYKMCADINDVEYRAVPLDENFCLSADKLLAACDKNTKLIWLCSPNNPTGNHLDAAEIERVLQSFDGIVVIDEAYSDFSSHPVFRLQIDRYPHLIVFNTMSKAWGGASIRLGMAFADKPIIDLYNKVKYPYNIGLPTQEKALEILNDPFEVDKWIRLLIQERNSLMSALSELSICEKIYPTDANFFLIKVSDAQAIYDYLLKREIIVRNRTRVALCYNCLRITVGTKSENSALLAALRQY